MNTLLKLSIISTSLLLAANVQAVPNIFSSGQPARADDVNANFTDVEAQISNNTSAIQTNTGNINVNGTAIQTNTSNIDINTTAIQTNTGNIGSNTTSIQSVSDSVTTNTTNIGNNTAAIAGMVPAVIYDYRDFAPAADISQKTFSTVGLCGTSEERTISSTVNGDNTDVLVTRRRLEGTGATCQLHDFSYINTPSQRQLVERRNYNTGGTLTATIAPDTEIILATSAMREGATFASGTSVDSTPAGGTPVFLGVLVDQRTVVGLEDVSVPAGSFTGCIKYSTIRNSNSFGEFQRVSWSCPGLGEVKRVQINTFPRASVPSRRYQMWELTGTLTSL